jgi:hypothetical protein
MKLPYEILIRGNADGTLSGCHAIDIVGGDARPITQADLATIAPAINAAALATNADELAKVKADLDAKNALIESAKEGIKTAIADKELDDTATVATIAQIVAIAELPSVEKRKAELAAEIAAKQEELQKL